jgi:hypothetical protein
MAYRIRGTVLTLFLSAFALHAAEEYTTWTYHQTVTLNTGATGANVTGTVTNFPVLVRLTAANAAVFTYAAAGGADLRFSKSNYADTLPYQIQRWDATDQLAEIWVLVDTVYGNTTTSIVMHYGNGAAPSHSSGPSVFNAVSGYAAVWHLQDTTDACGKLPLTGATKPTTQYGGVIGSAYNFNGTSMFYKTADSTSTYVNSLNFAYTTPFTLSGWEWDNLATAGNRMIVSKSGATWNMGERNPTGAATYDLEMMVTGGPTGDVNYIWDSTSIAPVIPLYNHWHHIVGVRSPTQGTSPTYVESLYVDGVLSDNPVPDPIPDAAGATTTRAIDIGYEPDANGNTSYFWNGAIEEVAVSTVARSSAWVRLSYQNQQTTQTLVQFAGLTVSSPTLTSPANGGINQPIAPTLTWTSVNGVESYSVQVATNSGFTNTVFSQSGLAATSQAISPDLANGTTYYWQVNALAANGGTSPWSGVWSFTTMIISNPGILNATIYNLSTSATISGATVQMTSGGSQSQITNSSGVANFSSIPAGNYVFSIIAPGYFLDTGIAVVIIAGQTTNEGWFLTPIPPPPAPTLIAPSNNASNVSTSPTISWNSATNATSYRLQVSTSSGFVSIAYDQSGLSALQATVSGLSNNTIAYWHVNAANVSGTSIWSPMWSFTTIPSPPNPPSLVSPSDSASDISLAPALSWNVASGALSYQVQIATIESFSTTIFTMSGLTTTSTTGSGLSYSTIYFWQANASNAGGTGNWSSIWSFTTMPLPPPNAPNLVSPTNDTNLGNSTAATLTWSTSITAASYRLQASLASTFAPVIFDQSGITGTSMEIGGIPQGVIVYWHVNATNVSGTSVWSNTWIFMTNPTAVLTQNDAIHSKRISFSNSGITYVLPSASNVSIFLYDVKGRQVRQLVSGRQNAGSYSINFNHAKVTAGYYIVEFKAGTFIVQRKLALTE